MVKVTSIDPNQSFLAILAWELLQKYQDCPLDLANCLIFLPTRRACRSLAKTLLQQSNNKAMVLPHLVPLGGINHLELGIYELDLPPIIHDMERQFFLAKLLLANHKIPSTTQALALAKSLMSFIDQVNLQKLNWHDLNNIELNQASDHWQTILDFLQVITHHWPQILQEMGKIEQSSMQVQVISWLHENPQFFAKFNQVIVAGSTGSLAINRELIKTIVRLDHGQLILPGLDLEFAKNIAELPTPEHPQHCMLNLLQELEIHINQVTDHEMPQLTTKFIWNGLHYQQPPQTATINRPNLQYIECQNLEDEALTIAILMREVLEDRDKTALLITHDRTIARLVSAKLQSWEINVDDSGGKPMDKSVEGVFITHITRLVSLYLQGKQHSYDYIQCVLTLLKHPQCTFLGDRSLHLNTVRQWEKQLRCHQISLNKIKEITDHVDEILSQNLTKQPTLHQIFTNLHNLALILSQNNIVKTKIGKKCLEILQNDYAKILDNNQINYDELVGIISCLLATQSIRLDCPSTSRLMILGPLEARLMEADRLILAGLNEGSWPIIQEPNPWLNGTMAQDFGLPSPQQKSGLSCHDFVQMAAKSEVFCTRSTQMQGVTTLASRFLVKLEAHIKQYGLNWHNNYYQKLARKLRCAQEKDYKLQKPEPNPPIESRPQRLSATHIKTLIHNPYQLYIQKVLKLNPLSSLHQQSLNLDKGILYHKLLEVQIKHKSGQMIENTRSFITEHSPYTPQLWQSFWAKKLDLVSKWLQNNYNPKLIYKTEIKGKIKLEDLEIVAIADRIDIDLNHNINIIDYKTGTPPTIKALTTHEYPQLAIEALIAKNNGFDINCNRVQELNILTLKGHQNTTLTINDNMEQLTKNMEHIIKDLNHYYIKQQNSFIPSYSSQKYNPGFAHFARLEEWVQ